MAFREELRQWREDLAFSTQTAYVVRMLCYCYNWATKPSAMRTDQEHRICRRIARRCRLRLARYSGWHESEGGRLFCDSGAFLRVA